MGILSKLFGPKAPTVLPVHVDDSNFNAEVRQSSIPVLLDVWSPLCEGFRGELYHRDFIENELLQPADSAANAANMAR
jgi:hypothetical protein